ncbi:hypothetical protein ACJX0J_030629, partial [Zea mays]
FFGLPLYQKNIVWNRAQIILKVWKLSIVFIISRKHFFIVIFHLWLHFYQFMIEFFYGFVYSLQAAIYGSIIVFTHLLQNLTWFFHCDWLIGFMWVLQVGHVSCIKYQINLHLSDHFLDSFRLEIFVTAFIIIGSSNLFLFGMSELGKWEIIHNLKKEWYFGACFFDNMFFIKNNQSTSRGKLDLLAGGIKASLPIDYSKFLMHQYFLLCSTTMHDNMEDLSFSRVENRFFKELGKENKLKEDRFWFTFINTTLWTPNIQIEVLRTIYRNFVIIMMSTCLEHQISYHYDYFTILHGYMYNLLNISLFVSYIGAT